VVKWSQLKSWLTTTLPALGSLGLLTAAFVDASVIPLPLVPDLLLINLCSAHPLRMPYYAAITALGATVGSLVVYYPARKAGQAYYHARHSHAPGRIQKLVQKYPALCVFLPAVAPFPLPVKPFVIAQGVFQVPLTTFLVGTLAGKACRFLAEAFLGVRYGPAALHFLVAQKWSVLIALLVLGILFFLLRRLKVFHGREQSQID
jgi:membrane protein YqaA with SNARE-associated domain